MIRSVKKKRSSYDRYRKWTVEQWNDWCVSVAYDEKDTSKSLTRPRPLDPTVTEEELRNWIPKFVESLKRNDGRRYSKGSVKMILSSLHVYCEEVCNFHGPPFLDKRSSIYPSIKRFLDKYDEMSSRDDNLIMHLDARDENRLWCTGVFNLTTARGLLFAVYFYNLKFLNLPKSDHRSLKVDQFSFLRDKDGNHFVEYRSPLFKSKDYSVSKKMLQAVIDLYDVGEPNSYYKIIKTYIDCLPMARQNFAKLHITCRCLN
uniref:DUF3504 domain-containing protein n=1 Tax=Tetranychus urticae TaxID=32264 RepID=T1L3A2_TETUR